MILKSEKLWRSDYLSDTEEKNLFANDHNSSVFLSACLLSLIWSRLLTIFVHLLVGWSGLVVLILLVVHFSASYKTNKKKALDNPFQLLSTGLILFTGRKTLI